MSFLPQVAALVTMFNMGPLRVNRPGLPTRDAFGDAVDASPVEFDLNPVHVQTVTGRDLEQVPEADRHKETICLFTHDRLHVADDGEVADRIEYPRGCGRSYRVINVENYQPHGDVYMALAQLEDVPFASEDC